MEQKDYRLAAILYTDIAGFSRMLERGEAATLRLLEFHNELIAGIVGRHHGTIVKTIGDALLIDFKNTVEALQSALEIQDKLYAYNKDHVQQPLLVRIGLHLGDIYFFENDALGEGINIAAGLQTLAKPGCICFSQDVHNLVLDKLEFKAEELGKVSLKNIAKEIQAYEIASPNIEFDPDHGKPRPDYRNGSFSGLAGAVGTAVSEGGAVEGPEAAPAPGSRQPDTEAEPEPGSRQPGSFARSYTEEGSRSILAEIRRAILQDTKAMGRRLSVEEARTRYRHYGVEAEEVIAAMAGQGLLTRSAAGARPGSGGPAGQGGGPGSFGGPASFGGFGGPGGPGAGPGGFGGFGAPGGFDGRALGQNIRAAVEGIVGEIQRNVAENVERAKAEGYDRGGYYHGKDEYERHIERHRRRMQRRMQRHELRHDMKHGDFENDELMKSRERSAATFEEYRSVLEARAHRQRGGLCGHLTSYLAVNAVLWYINLSASDHHFLWAAIVSSGWGIGLISSIASALRSGAKLREIEAMPELEGQSLKDYKNLNRVRDSLAMHGAGTIGVTALFGVLQALTLGTTSFWLLIPVGAMLLGFISHLASYAATKPRLQKKILAALGISGGWRNIFRRGRARREEDEGLGPYAALYREAESTTDAIVEQLRSGQTGPMDQDMIPSLQEYLGQVRLLARSASEIDRLVEAIPAAELGKDREALAAKASQAASEQLKSEYRSSIAEIEKQEKAYQELKEQSEIVRLRLGSSVNQLKQMRIDIARISATPGPGEGPRVDQFKSRTEELSRYLEDLRSSFRAERDAERDDPFAELERLEREERERAARAEPTGHARLDDPGSKTGPLDP